MVNGVAGRMGAAPLRSFDPSAWPDGGASAAIVARTLAAEAQLIASVSKRIVEADPTASIGVIVRSSWRRGEIDKAFAALPSIQCRRWDLAIEDPAILERLRTAVAVMPKDIGFDEAEQKIIATLDPADIDTIEQIEDAFYQLSQGAASSVRGALNQFRVRNDDAAVSPGVHLLNAHTGKGQQFDWVFVPGLEEKHVPDRRCVSNDGLAEEERVLLVMLSRARHGVVVTTATNLDGKYGPYPSTRSRWWADLAASATMDREALNAHLDRNYPAAGTS